MTTGETECAPAPAGRTAPNPSGGITRRRGRFVPLLLLAPAAVVLGVFFFALASMVRVSFAPNLGPAIVGDGWTLESYGAFLGSTFHLGYLGRSLWIAAYCTTITAVLGYTIAYFMYRSGPRMRLFAGTVLIVQFFTAYVIRAYAVMLVIGKTGIINQFLVSFGIVEAPLRLLFTEPGVAIGMVMISLPFMVFPILTGLQAIPANLEVAASSLGATDRVVFWKVLFPLSLPGLAAGVVIVYLFALTSYIVPGILGGGYVDMIANLIYAKAMQVFDLPFAAATAAVMLLISGAAVYLLQKGFRLLTPPLT